MAPPPTLIARLGVARILLRKHVGTPSHEAVSLAQKDAVLAVMSRVTETLGEMEAHDHSAIVSLASDAPWCAKHLDEILGPLLKAQENRNSRETEKKTRRPSQEFTPNILHYFTAAEWDRFTQEKSQHKAEFLITRVLQLGGINLTEPCKAWLSALLVKMVGLENATQRTKQEFYDGFKIEYKRRARRVKDCVYIEVLPSPAECKRLYPDLYHGIFGEEDPIASRVNTSEAFFNAIHCRPGKGMKALLAIANVDQPDSPRETEAAGSDDNQSQIVLLREMNALQKDHMALIKSTTENPRRMSCLKSLSAVQPLTTSTPPLMSRQGLLPARALAPPLRAIQDEQASRLGSPSPPQRIMSANVLEAAPSLSSPRQLPAATPSLGAPRLTPAEDAVNLMSEEDEAVMVDDSQATQAYDLGRPVEEPPLQDVASQEAESQATDSSSLSEQQKQQQQEALARKHIPISSAPPPPPQDLALVPASSALAPRATEEVLVAVPASPAVPVAQRILENMDDLGRARGTARAKAQRETKEAAAKAKADAKAKASDSVAKAAAKAIGKATPKVEPKVQPKPAAAAQPKPAAAAAGGLKRMRTGVSDESTRGNFRVRLEDGTSKGFKYDEATKEQVRQEAHAFYASHQG